MYLNRPAFPVSFSIEDTVELIQSMIKSKNWTDFEVADVKLVYIPFWIFNYDTYMEAPAEEGGNSAVSRTDSGKMALNAYTNEIDENVSFIYDSPDAQMQNKPTSEYPYEIQRPKIREREAREIASIRLAARQGVRKENVVISGLELLYLPLWVAWVTVAEGTYKLQINAVNGEILNEEQVPAREKGWLEVTSETLQELKQPGAWVNYTTQIGGGLISFLLNNSITKGIIHQVKTNRTVQIIILAAIAILVIAWVTGF